MLLCYPTVCFARSFNISCSNNPHSPLLPPPPPLLPPSSPLLPPSPLPSQRVWSDPGSWPNGRLPVEGDDVTIAARWRMLLDVSPPPLASVYVLGELLFEDEADLNFTANLVSVAIGSRFFHRIYGVATERILQCRSTCIVD